MYQINHPDNSLPQITRVTDPVEITRLLEADAQAEQANPLPVDNINTNPMEVKQEMNKIIMGHTLPTPTPAPAPAPAPSPEWADVLSKFDGLFNAALAYIKPQLEHMVHAKFTAMVDNSLALAKLDADIEQRMREIAEEIADEKLYDHERNENHYGSDYIEDKVSDAVRDAGLSERRIEEMISDAIDQHTSDTDHKDEGDIEHIVGEFTEANDFLTKENLGETLRGMTFDITARY